MWMGPEFFMHITFDRTGEQRNDVGILLSREICVGLYIAFFFSSHCLKQPGQALIINEKTLELYESFRRKAENGHMFILYCKKKSRGSWFSSFISPQCFYLLNCFYLYKKWVNEEGFRLDQISKFDENRVFQKQMLSKAYISKKSKPMGL